MDSKCKCWMLLLTLLCVISLSFSLFRVFPCEVGNETFLGIVLSAVGIIVALVMGYQIFSVVEFRGELQKQKEENIKLAHDNAKLQQMIRNQMGALDKQRGSLVQAHLEAQKIKPCKSITCKALLFLYISKLHPICTHNS